MDQIEARLAMTGEVRLPGVGLLRRTSGGVVLGVEADLLAAVNRTYEGLRPVGTAPPTPSARPAAPTQDRAETPPGPATQDTPATPPADDEAAPTMAPPSTPAPEPSAASAGPASAPSDGPSAPPADSSEDVDTQTATPSAASSSEDGPVRDLSSDASAPFAPPTSADVEPEFDPAWRPPSVPTEEDAGLSETGTEGPAAGEASALPDPAPPGPGPQASPRFDGDLSPDEAVWMDPSTPDAADDPAHSDRQPADLSPSDVSFVDDDTLDADLDDVLAVPFGSAGGDLGLADVLPPTLPDRVPGPRRAGLGPRQRR